MVEKMCALGKKSSVIREIFEYGRKRKAAIGAENVFDFSLGNPSVPAPAIVTETLNRLITETPAAALHAYTSAPGADDVRRAIASYISETYGAPAVPERVYMTVGAAASLTITLTALVEEGDEVAVPVPFFPEYRVFVERTGARFVPFASREGDLQIDRAALEKAINPRTKAVIVNSPNNPSGAVLSEESLRLLAKVLTERSQAYGHPIYLISDEPYRELTYGGVAVPWLPLIYKNTIVCYSFSKSLSLPGERIGYIFVSPEAEESADLFAAVCGAGRALGFVCAPSLFQYLVKDCLGKTADVSIYETNRDLLYTALTEMGFEVVKPDGAFYLFMKTPVADAAAFCEKAKEWELLLVPSDDFGCPGYVRISYCVTTEQCKRALPAFRALAEAYQLCK